MTRFFLLFSLLIWAFLASGCSKNHTKKSMPPLEISAAKASLSTLYEPIWFATTTTPIRSATIEPRVDGYLESILYESGKPVARGQKIFEIDPSQIITSLYAAEASLRSAEASLVEAESNYQRAQPLARLNAISRTSLDEYRTTLAAAKADLKTAEQTLRNAQLDYSYTKINAPLDGIIAETLATEGDYVGPATSFATLTTIEQLDTLCVNLAIPTSQYLRYVGSEASFDNSTLLSDITLILSDSTTFSHKILYNYTEQSATSGSSQVVVVGMIPNPELTLKAGMFSRVRANIGSPTQRLLVPQRAVTQNQGVNSVWIIKPDSTVSFRKVTLGATFGTMWQIDSGITSEDIVATSAQMKLHEGAKVTYKL